MPSSCPHWLRLNRDYTIVAASDNAPATLSQSVGRCLWQAFPGSQEAFEPTYGKAWADGCASGVCRYAGNIVCVHAIRETNRRLLVSAEAVTIEGLRELLDTLAAEIEREHVTNRRLTLVPAATG